MQERIDKKIEEVKIMLGKDIVVLLKQVYQHRLKKNYEKRRTLQTISH